MTTKTKDAIRTAAQILQAHNLWRRHDGETMPMPHDPHSVGEAIDTLCAFAKRQTRAKDKTVRKISTWRDTRANCS